jgi:hypothetical protein
VERTLRRFYDPVGHLSVASFASPQHWLALISVAGAATIAASGAVVSAGKARP